MNQQEQHDFLLSTFREEVEGHVINLTRGLVDLEESEDAQARLELMREMMRVLHTVKGASRMLGFSEITRVSHAMEDLVGHYRNGQNGAIGRDQIDLLFVGVDTISELVRFVTRPSDDSFGTPFTQLTQPEHVNSLVEQLKQMAGVTEPEISSSDKHDSFKENGHATTPSPVVTPKAVAREPETVTPVEQKVEQAPAARGEARADESIRVRLDKLDSMINLAGELVINKLQNEEHLAALNTLMALNRQRNRLQIQLRDFVVEQIPLEERSRLLGITELFSFGDEELKVAKEQFLKSRHYKTGSSGNGLSPNGLATLPEASTNTSHTVLDGRAIRKIYTKLEQLVEIDNEIEQQLSEMLRERKNFNLGFEMVADELRRNMLGIRMLPLDTLFSRFARLVRDTSNARGKQVRLVVTGGTVEIDKRILEEIVDPLQHLLSNAVEHGIEKPEERLAAGKPAEGTITLSAQQRGNHVHIKVSDDGYGIDPQRLLSVAVNKGFVTVEEARSLSNDDVLDLVFRAGFSTRDKADEVSGRGVGLDVVQQNIKHLSGRVSLVSQQGLGSTFSLEIPLTLATIDVLLVRSAGQLFAIPSVMVEATLRLPRSEVSSLEGKQVIRLRDQLVPVIRLDHILSLRPLENRENEKQNSNDGYFPAVMLSASVGGSSALDRGIERFICFEVEDLVDEREVVVKGLNRFLENTPNIAGATLLGADGLALILDVFGLIQTVRQGGVAPVVPVQSHSSSDFMLGQQAHRILVVDDSLATRELERSILQTAGYEVETARDGIEALQLARQSDFDLILTDIEMPNMDGFRLTTTIINDERLRSVPVIVVSSRESEEDKRRGMEAGAKAYIVKGQFEQNRLLETIARLIV